MTERPNGLRLYTRPHSYRTNLMDSDDDDDDDDLEAGEASLDESTSTKTLKQPLEQTTASSGANKTSKDHVAESPTPSHDSTSVPESSLSNVNSGKRILAISDKDSDDDYNNGKKKKRRNRGFLSCWSGRQDNDWFQQWSEKWMNSHWPILLVSVLVFAVLAGAGIALYLVVAHSQEDDLQDKIMDLAVETGDWFSTELDFAIMPLFSMAQFATELEIFADLPDKIKSAGEPGALPFLPDRERTVRNVTGVCDEPQLVERFTQIASAVKTNAKMSGILHNIQLAPEGVICLLHPMNNTEDFSDGKSYLDNTGAWGIDLLNDSFHQYIARQSLKQEEVGIVGPRALTQCPTCGLYFIIRLPVVSRTHFIEIDGEAVPRWGFATALVNWGALVERGGIHERFRTNGYGFKLTRTDRNYNDETGTYDEDVVVLAESENYGDKRKEVSTALQTTNNEWVIWIEYDESSELTYIIVVLSTLFVAIFIAALVYTVLLQKQSHMAMVSDTFAEKSKAELERHLTAALAHELRNPLGAIDSALAIMPSNISAEARELVASMQLCTSFMQSIMSNLLDSRKLEEGKMTLLNNPFSLIGLLEEIFRMMTPAVGGDVKWLVDVQSIPKEKEWVYGDDKRIQQIMTNLISNAIKHTRKGSITISASWMRTDDDSRDLVKLMCQDTGPGIPKEEQADLFNRFTTRGGAPGSGLGLSIAKQLVDLMDGAIWFESDPTVKPGTACVVMLPLKICEIPQQPKEDESGLSAEEDKSPLTEPLKILLTDDIKMNRMMLKRRFQKCIAPNCIISETATGEEALKICETEKFDIIVMDQFMQEAGGVLLGTDVVIALRRAEVDSIIVGCSGNDLDDKFHTAGAELVWKKPVPPNETMIKSFRQLLAAKALS